MLCTRCKAAEAGFFYKQNINGKETSMALCPRCAKEIGVDLPGSSLFSPFFGSLYADKSRNPRRNASEVKRCRLCALTFSDIVKLGKVGCPECYATFREELADTIRSIHGTAKHTGRSPSGSESKETAPEKAPTESEEEKLRAALENAVKTENYEKAAELRDALRALKGEA